MTLSVTLHKKLNNIWSRVNIIVFMVCEQRDRDIRPLYIQTDYLTYTYLFVTDYANRIFHC